MGLGSVGSVSGEIFMIFIDASDSKFHDVRTRCRAFGFVQKLSKIKHPRAIPISAEDADLFDLHVQEGDLLVLGLQPQLGTSGRHCLTTED